MTNFNNLMKYVTYINMQARVLLDKSAKLSEDTLNLRQVGTSIEQPRGLRMTLDIGYDNELTRRAHDTTDVITRLNRLFDILLERTCTLEGEGTEVNNRLRRRRDVVEDDDDDVTFILERRRD